MTDQTPTLLEATYLEYPDSIRDTILTAVSHAIEEENMGASHHVQTGIVLEAGSGYYGVFGRYAVALINDQNTVDGITVVRAPAFGARGEVIAKIDTEDYTHSCALHVVTRSTAEGQTTSASFLTSRVEFVEMLDE